MNAIVMVLERKRNNIQAKHIQYDFFCFCVSFIVRYTVALTEVASYSVCYYTVSVLYVLIVVVLNAYHQLHVHFVCCLSLWIVPIPNFYRCQFDYYQRIFNKKIKGIF